MTEWMWTGLWIASLMLSLWCITYRNQRRARQVREDRMRARLHRERVADCGCREVKR